jgi:hypothetical protein
MLTYHLQSPRFLIANGREDEALQVLTKYHGNGELTEFVKTEHLEICEILAYEKQAASKVGWLDLLRTPGNRKRTLICFLNGLFSQWCGYVL